METQKINKTKILEQMAKDIGSDAFGLSKKIGKGAAYLASAPIIGLLNPAVRDKIYDSYAGDRCAQAISGFCEMAGAIAIVNNYAPKCNSLEGTLLGLSVPVLFLEGFLRVGMSPTFIEEGNIGSLGGYLPSKAIEYVCNKYNSAKSRLELKGGSD